MNLDVLIPSLAFPTSPSPAVLPPHIPAIERLLARADKRIDVVPSEYSWLCERWGLTPPYPMAPLLAEHDGLDASCDGWLFAEPVHLIADRDRLTMFSSSFLDIDATETAELVSALNLHFADRQLQFFAPSPALSTPRWYVRCASAEIPATTSPNAARTGALIDFQPESFGRVNWRSLQNEAQMLFFGHPVNQARDAAGKLTVSGVWFWGGGVLPQLTRPPYDLVVSNSDAAIHLARKTGIDLQPPRWNSIQSDQGNVLATIESSNEFAGNLYFPAEANELEHFDCEWFRPISQALKTGTIARLRIFVPGAGFLQSFQITRRNQLLRFWRTAKPLSTYA